MLVGGGGGGGRREAPSAAHCLPGQHAPRLPSSQELENKRKEKKAKTKERERRQDIPRTRLISTGHCRVLPPKDGLKITLKAINADNDSEKSSRSIFGRS